MVDAFDADVLIYAAMSITRGRDIMRLFEKAEPGKAIGIGSVLLLPEVLSKPQRDGSSDEYARLQELLGHLDLIHVDRTLAQLATTFGATYHLRAADAIHLATAVAAGADRFITNNRSDFSTEITEIDIVYPDQLA